MSKILYLLRHGKSDWSLSVSDFQRPLKKRGVEETARLGTWLREGGYLLPELIVSSSAERARHTAKLVCAAMSVSKERLVLAEKLYMADIKSLLSVIQSTDEAINSLMLVGHNPGMEELLIYLAGESLQQTSMLKVLPTATVVCLELESGWSDIKTTSCSVQFSKRGK